MARDRVGDEVERTGEAEITAVYLKKKKNYYCSPSRRWNRVMKTCAELAGGITDSIKREGRGWGVEKKKKKKKQF